MTLIGAALKRINNLENESAFRDRPLGDLMAERSRRVEHARRLLWHSLRTQGINPLTMKTEYSHKR